MAITTGTKSQSKYHSRRTWVHKKSLQITNLKPYQNSKHLFWNFDSKLEANCFLKILQFYAPEYNIRLNPKIKILEATKNDAYNGKLDCCFWRPDFLLIHKTDKNRMYVIESKGKVIQPFPLQYCLFRLAYPHIPIFVVSEANQIAKLAKPDQMGNYIAILENM